MKHKKINFSLTLFFICISFSGLSQISIEFPVERTVFQRNNSNLGTINIFGNVTQDCDRVEARLETRQSDQGESTGWLTIDSNIEGGAYLGKIQHKGGWYRLEIRAIRDEKVISSSAVERVGIGEVFVIAGQSNAQGDGQDIGARGATDDRVNAYLPNYFNRNTYRYENLPEFLDNISFTKIETSTNIGPGGYTPWCYAELGDMLVAKLNVPVMFFNAAYTGTSTQNWIQSIRNEYTQHAFFPVLLPLGYPYKALKVTLQSINTLVGIRSVLWHQGEFDAALGVPQWQYYENLQNIILQTRNDIGNDLSWMVSRATRYYGEISPSVIAAQNQIIKNVPNVWPGPETDNIQPNRYDNAHFQNISGSPGLTQLAQAWNQALDQNFFSSSKVVLPKDILQLNHYCINQSTVRLELSSSFKEYYWNNQKGGGSSIDGQSGYRFVTTRDARGNVYRSNTLVIEDVYPKTPPQILAPEGLMGCVGKSLQLEVENERFGVQWSNGSNNQAIEINTSGAYSAKFKTPQNCYSVSSSTLSVSFIDPPQKPVLAFLDGGGFKCEGETVTVALTNTQGADILWSTGSTSRELKLRDNSLQNISTTLYSLPNCPSLPSDTVLYRIYDNPSVASIGYEGPFYLRALPSGEVDSYQWYFGGNRIADQQGNILHIDKIGAYNLAVEKDYFTPVGNKVTCLSPLSQAFTTKENATLKGYSVYPNPNTDGLLKITSDGERENVNLELYDEKGRRVYETHIDKVNFPYTLDLRSKEFMGRFFMVLKYQTQSRTFPLIFVK